MTIENLIVSDSMNESRSWESKATHYIVLFVEKNPAPGAHARSLFIGQEPADTVVQFIKSKPARFNKCLPLCFPVFRVILDLNDALLPDGEWDGLLCRNLLQKV